MSGAFILHSLSPSLLTDEAAEAQWGNIAGPGSPVPVSLGLVKEESQGGSLSPFVSAPHMEPEQPQRGGPED